MNILKYSMGIKINNMDTLISNQKIIQFSLYNIKHKLKQYFVLKWVILL